MKHANFEIRTKTNAVIIASAEDAEVCVEWVEAVEDHAEVEAVTIIVENANLIANQDPIKRSYIFISTILLFDRTVFFYLVGS